jgi:hypothetical protein
MSSPIGRFPDVAFCREVKKVFSAIFVPFAVRMKLPA